MSAPSSKAMRDAMDKIRNLESMAARNAEIHSRMLQLMYLHEKNLDQRYFLEMLSLLHSLKPAPKGQA